MPRVRRSYPLKLEQDDFRSKRGLRMPQPRRPRRGQAVATILLDVVPPAPAVHE
jgi:hypothetical protein